ncbi:MAG: HlyC/CorC family transporter [Alphaproteobacteria bacterium]|nr:HlyC/CorC family transporter [Alphaproteobacteria bacterium]
MFTELLIVVVLIFINGFFAMAEIAIVSARRARLKPLAEAGHKGAQAALRLAENPSAFLSTVQTGITLVGVLASVFSGATIALRLGDTLNRAFPLLAPHGETVALVIVVALVAYLTLFVGELVPKRIAMARAEPIALAVAEWLTLIGRCLHPLVWFLHTTTDMTLRLLGIRDTGASGVTEEEVKSMIAEGTQEGVFEAEEKKMLEGVMRLTDRTVRSIMTPRLDMVWVGSEDPDTEIRNTIRSSGYSRLPVARGDLEEVRGVLHAKDMLNAALNGQQLQIDKLQRPLLSVPETTPVLKLLEQFKSSGQHMAVVIDEYGTVEGLVTIADILMAIAGALPEEGHDNADKPVRRADGSWLLGGMTPINEVEELLGLKKMHEDGDFHTLAGFMLAEMGHIPETGDKFSWQSLVFEVLDMDGRRIDKVLITPPSATVAPQG